MFGNYLFLGFCYSQIHIVNQACKCRCAAKSSNRHLFFRAATVSIASIFSPHRVASVFNVVVWDSPGRRRPKGNTGSTALYTKDKQHIFCNVNEHA